MAGSLILWISPSLLQARHLQSLCVFACLLIEWILLYLRLTGVESKECSFDFFIFAGIPLIASMTGLQRNRRRCCCSFLLSLVAWCLLDDNHVVEAQRLLRRVGKSINNYNVTGARFLASDGVTEMVHVIISLKENVSSFPYGGLALTSNFERTNAVRATIRASEWIDILEHADVLGIEEDPSVYPMGEQMPWGVYAVQGDMMGVPLPPQVFEQYDPTYDTVTNPNCFAVCIVDSGVLLSHPDFVSD